MAVELSLLPNLLDRSHQPTRSAPSREQMPQKWPYFRQLTRTTALQPESPLSANSAKIPDF